MNYIRCFCPIDNDISNDKGPCSQNPCAHGGYCHELNGTDYSCMCQKRCYGKNCESCTTAKFKFDLGNPVLMFFQRDVKSTLQYLGPQNIPDLLSFIKEQTGRGPTMIKVIN